MVFQVRYSSTYKGRYLFALSNCDSPLIGDDCFIEEQGKTFHGHLDMINESVLNKILKGDPNPLSDLPMERQITHFFSAKKT